MLESLSDRGYGPKIDREDRNLLGWAIIFFLIVVIFRLYP